MPLTDRRPSLAELPETPVILALLAELMPARPEPPAAPRPPELIDWSWATLRGRVNWRNDPDQAHPARGPRKSAVRPVNLVPAVLGELAVAAYFGLVNWHNAVNTAAPPAPAPPTPAAAEEPALEAGQVGSVLGEFGWD
jgi:hypothetical protein